jgi:hypothetical protein
MAQTLSAILALLPVALAIVSFVLTVLAVTDKDWAHQNTYDGQNIPISQWTTPLYTLYRSPFWTCSPVTSSANTTAGLNTTHTITCARFNPGQGACEGLVGTNISDTNARYGDDRMCQQVDLAGNLAIAAAVFVGVAMLVLFALAALTIPKLFSGSTSTTSSSGQASAAPTITLTTGLSASVIGLFLGGAAMLVLAQFYGLEGLVQSAMPNADFASDGNLPTSVGPWVQGKASLVYASVGWLAAVLAAGAVFVVWGVPSFAVGQTVYTAINTGDGHGGGDGEGNHHHHDDNHHHKP